MANNTTLLPPIEHKRAGGVDIVLGIQWGDEGKGRVIDLLAKDYAIVARFRDQASGSIVVVAAGLGAYGTLAAGEVLSNESYLQQIVSHAPRDWKTMNMEAVIETQVINDNSGPPMVLATYFW